MYTPEWWLALECQACITVVGILIATIVLRIRFRAAVFAALLFCPVAVTTPPGFATPLFIGDIFMPIVALVALAGLRRIPGGFVALVILTTFAWPAVGTLLGVMEGMGGYNWMTFLYRRFGYGMFLLAGASGRLPGIRPRDLFDTFVVLWIGMAVVGLLQFNGLINVAFQLKSEFAEAGANIAESAAAQHGFLGLNRAGVGIWGGIILTYCAAHLLLERRLGAARFLLFVVASALSAVVILFAGSRTGMFVSLVGVAYVSLKTVASLKHARLGRSMVFAVLGAGMAFYFLLPALGTVTGRLEPGLGFQTQSFGRRVVTQKAAIQHILTHPEGAIFGMGENAGRFMATLNQLNHPHSEYVQVLWNSGVPGLVLYLILLYHLWARLRPRPGAELDVMGIAGRGMLLVGMVAGLAIGNFMIASGRLAAYSMMILFSVGRIIGRPKPEGELRTVNPTPKAYSPDAFFAGRRYTRWSY